MPEQIDVNSQILIESEQHLTLEQAERVRAYFKEAMDGRKPIVCMPGFKVRHLGDEQMAARMERIEQKLDTLIAALAEEAPLDPLLTEAGLYPERDQSQPL